MEAKCYRAMRHAQGKMLREYFSGVSDVEQSIRNRGDAYIASARSIRPKI